MRKKTNSLLVRSMKSCTFAARINHIIYINHMENKYITVAYKLYAITDGKKEMLEEAPAEHPFQFISGLGYTLERFEKEIMALSQGSSFNFTIPCNEMRPR